MREKTGASKRGNFASTTEVCLGSSNKPLILGVQMPYLPVFTKRISHWGPEKNGSMGKTVLLETFYLLHSLIWFTLTVLFVLNIIPESPFMVPRVIFLCWWDLSRCGKWISFNCRHLRDIDNVFVLACMFSHWVEAFPWRRATALAVGTLSLEKNDSHLGNAIWIT